jgi:hypothetical protein
MLTPFPLIGRPLHFITKPTITKAITMHIPGKAFHLPAYWEIMIAIVIIRIALAQYFKGMDYVEFTLLTMVLAFVYVCIP